MLAICAVAAAWAVEPAMSSQVSPASAPQERRGSACWGLTRAGGKRSLLYDAFMLLPALLFLVFLVARARSSLRKLFRSKSNIMTTYYAFLWIISILNVCWCFLEMWQTRHGQAAITWNVMSIGTRFGMVLLEVSVVIFLSQGYLTSSWNALMHTLTLSGTVAAIDAILKAIYIFWVGVPLFVLGDDAGDGKKWGFWFIHSFIFAGVYFIILMLPYTKWRDHLPARPSFYNYVFILFVFNSVAVLGSLLLCFGADFGHCLYSLAGFSYYALYPPLLYVTFLADFFKEEDFQLEDIYYSEMKDAGYFDADWD
ncbi:hypothetical protein O6H91_02G101700 [Diphasiastrum complanatum]|uniref:Uncharacterized protein n=1 Tax=Diphasiastrum complanatum TaxID=34168 RepID=A0ACC2EIH6_DIPCM|nr:hypothetical protein O6H91_02G101700 [Diphasiastrum complanatum]